MLKSIRLPRRSSCHRQKGLRGQILGECTVAGARDQEAEHLRFVAIKQISELNASPPPETFAAFIRRTPG